MANVVIKRVVAARNVDALNRSAIATADLENGSVFTLTERSTVDGEDEVWTVGTPTATSTGIWMAATSEVVTTTVGEGDYQVQYRGIVVDPRNFTNVAGIVFSAFQPKIGDVIEMTMGDATNDYLNVAADTTLEAATAAGTGFSMHKIGTSILHIGNASLVKTPVTTYLYEVVNN